MFENAGSSISHFERVTAAPIHLQEQFCNVIVCRGAFNTFEFTAIQHSLHAEPTDMVSIVAENIGKSVRLSFCQRRMILMKIIQSLAFVLQEIFYLYSISHRCDVIVMRIYKRSLD